MRIDRIIHGVVAQGRAYAALMDSVQRRRPGDALKLNGGKQQCRRRAERLNVRVRVAVRHSQARLSIMRKPLDRVARKHADALTILIVVLGDQRGKRDLLAKQQRSLARLIEIVTAGKKCDARGDLLVKQIRLAESDSEIPLHRSELSRKRQGLAQSQEIIRLISQAEEAAGNSADSTSKGNRLFLLFLDLQI